MRNAQIAHVGSNLAAFTPVNRNYRPRSPQHGVLHQIVRDHYETLRYELSERSDGHGVPEFVEKEFHRFLQCGVLAHGFARFVCQPCQVDRLVAFSCKGRGFCPSCGGRRMTERAANLVDAVLPHVPVRQWVLSLPFDLRFILAWEHKLCCAVLRIYTRALQSFYRKRASKLGYPAGQSGCVTVIQRFGGALNLNVHFHTLALDGVFIEDKTGALRFAEISAPDEKDMRNVLCKIQTKISRLLVRRGLLPYDVNDASESIEEHNTLTQLYAASVRQQVATGQRCGTRLRRIGQRESRSFVQRERSCHATLDGFDLHARVVIKAAHRDRLEHLCRYLLRPAVAQERLSLTQNHKVLLRLKQPWHDGTHHVLFEPTELLEKLIALVPRPYTNLIVYHGVLAPNAKWRNRIVNYGNTKTAADEKSSTTSSKANYTWAELMRRGLNIDAAACPRCGQTMKLLAAVLGDDAIRQILAHLGLPVDPVRFARARPPPMLDEALAS